MRIGVLAQKRQKWQGKANDTPGGVVWQFAFIGRDR